MIWRKKMSEGGTESSQKIVAVASAGGKTFKIAEDAPVGFYLFVFQDGRCTHDYLQDDLEMAKRCAHHQFGVPLESWGQPKDEGNI
jgi:hypothetical protein